MFLGFKGLLLSFFAVGAIIFTIITTYLVFKKEESNNLNSQKKIKVRESQIRASSKQISQTIIQESPVLRTASG